MVKKKNSTKTDNDEWVEIKKYEFYPGNPRKISEVMLERLKKSITDFSENVFTLSMNHSHYRLTDPIIINETNGRIVGGNQRVKALLEMGQEVIHKDDIRFVSVENEQKERALNIALNRITGEWEDTLLKDILFDMDTEHQILSGFGEDDLADIIDRLMGAEEPVTGLIDDDEIPEVKETRVRTGDLWELGNHKLLCGDATKKEDVAILLGDEKADMVFTDPPYGVDYAGKNRFLNAVAPANRIEEPIINDDIEDYDKFYNGFLSLWLGILKESNSFYVTISGQKLSHLLNQINSLNYKTSQILVWVKNNHVIGRQDYSNKHELMVYGWVGKHKFYGGFQTTTWEFDKPQKSELHPTMKPVELVERAIINSSREGMIVLDPFGGSGTTLIACEKLGRECRMIEIDPWYCTVIIDRFNAFTGKMAKLINNTTGKNNDNAGDENDNI